MFKATGCINKLLILSTIIDETITLRSIGLVRENTVKYINGETNSTVWPGWFFTL